MPVEFIIVAVAFFDTKFTRKMCNKFYLFEPICTMVLIALCSSVHVNRIHAIYDKSRPILAGLAALLLVQIAVMTVCSAFYHVIPLLQGQGCIAGPTANWSLQSKPLSPWKLMLRDGLNLYGPIWIVNMVNVCFWFIVKPTGENDSIKTTVTSITAVLTTTMTLRIILPVRGSLAQAPTSSPRLVATPTHHTPRRFGPRHSYRVQSQNAGNGPNVFNIGTYGNPERKGSLSGGVPGVVGDGAYTLDEMRDKAANGEWNEGTSDGRSSVLEGKKGEAYGVPAARGYEGVEVTIDREVDYHGRK
ncbi:SubName: Full=Uncharacterized protein {ECO:0000313/EMBL:CCA74902.1} [Serendipita indica DSM 11827]|nr:SubName: Full=Uncharacterized protein {ECO:0000313/EMBL:CCA74902.1} [Serendipita indica DSM 11827]